MQLPLQWLLVLLRLLWLLWNKRRLLKLDLLCLFEQEDIERVQHFLLRGQARYFLLRGEIIRLRGCLFEYI